MMRGFSCTEDGDAPSTSSTSPPPPPPPHRQQMQAPRASSSGQPTSRRSTGNVFKLLARREVSPRSKHSLKKFWGEASECQLCPFQQSYEAVRDVRRSLISWVEAFSLQHLSAKYCPLMPPPRSTIAAAFSPDGKILASTHGDHTVKLIDSQTGSCLKVLRGHRRTPWVVRFHPLYPEILASGSLDHEVHLWDANTAECIGSRNFYRPIASIAFHAQGDLLAVASGHKLYIWHYNRSEETSSPTIVLRTPRSLRAVHFHPHAAPFLLTAEVNDLDLTDSAMTLATSPGYLHYPPPTIYLADAHPNERSRLEDELPLMPSPLLMWPSFTRDDGRATLPHIGGDVGLSGQQRVDSLSSGQYEFHPSPFEPSSSTSMHEETGTDPFSSVRESEVTQSAMNIVDNTEVQPEERSTYSFSFSDPRFWELPSVYGWLVGQTQAAPQTAPSPRALETASALGEVASVSPVRSEFMPGGMDQPRLGGRSGSGCRSSGSRMMRTAGLNDHPHDENYPQSVVSKLRSELEASLAAAASTELPCTVKLRVWPYDMKDPCALFRSESCRLTIPHAVLCSEMGAHFSPCGRFFAACVACVLPQLEADPVLHGQVDPDVTGVATSPTRHPVSAYQIMYELRIYSLEEATFGMVLASRSIRAAHCLTSIQFSPTSEHLLLAYGRRHNSLLKSIVIDGENTVPIYSILEVYRVSDMELVRVLPSAEDEVNVACFHPSVGGGLIYGTKEGKLRILQIDSSGGLNPKSTGFLDENMAEVPTYALEC
ncbi:hypothetical protein EUGRSUZ_H02881 [Eucalyptus grandis]|uniref:Uncharacterized protein n=4 Tax=Eucalyptus grandis TaxID=71139 RepID=A0A059B2M6_EUCGR|nr:hypothetical protein EUGRSUZ_H02881 [Eucalyptus grandis]KAK3417132.1 hypothetical protein EUGRSUZ_H02881 [Eucalyptus grandis]KAK3417133.1 hypothetical protein EUGRSUZ_H02881 [Eucalyptus grandis]